MRDTFISLKYKKKKLNLIVEKRNYEITFQMKNLKLHRYIKK